MFWILARIKVSVGLQAITGLHMYLPHHFIEADAGAVAALVAEFPLATLVATGPGGLLANHIPMLLAPDGRLIGHVAAANEIHRVIGEDAAVLAVFSGEDGYVSPNWYPGKAAHHRVVPTWNYRVVHVHGRISFIHDPKRKRAIVGRLTARFEREMNGDEAWKMADAPDDFMDSQLASIVGFEIAIDRIAGKSKLSQNREAEDFNGVRQAFEQCGEKGLAGQMERVERLRREK